MSEVYYWIWIQEILGINTTRSEKFLALNLNPERIWNMSEKEIHDLDFFTSIELNKIKNKDIKEKAKQAYEMALGIGAEIITPYDKKYPIRLKNIYSPPLTLYVLGDLPDVDNNLSIGMVGTRKCTDYGIKAAKHITEELSENNTIIVSGLALGIDAVCHKTAIETGGKTIAVIGSGIDNTYPIANFELRKKILNGNGAVVSELMPGIAPIAFNFHARNRIISAMSSGVCVVEAAERSGALATAAHALSQDRDVYAVPGSIFSEMSMGTNKLIQQGAIPALSGIDILKEYEDYKNYILTEKSRLKIKTENSHDNIKKQKTQKTSHMHINKSVPTYLNEEQKRVYNCLTDGMRTKEEISFMADLPIEKVLTALTQLEIFGEIKCVFGNKFTV